MLFATPLTAAQMALLSIPMGTAVDEPDGLPSRYELAQNYPNPFNPSTVIPYSVPESGDVVVTIYDVVGRPVAVLQDGFMPAGRHAVVWRADDLASGVYFYRLTASSFRASKSMLLVK
jgi:hypothetical protein